MSRTDKDAPYWVRATFYVPDHAYDCPDYRPRHHPREYPLRVCNLPAEPVRRHPNLSAWRRWREIGCIWEMSWVDDRWAIDINRDRPRGRIDRRLNWWGPDRSRTRDACRSAAREFNETGDVDTEPGTRNHRHSPGRGYW
jgi:hypothetical protein